jgi:hypothetical protein
MMTCVVDYIIDPSKIDSFEGFARRWIPIHIEAHEDGFNFATTPASVNVSFLMPRAKSRTPKSLWSERAPADRGRTDRK